MAIPMAAEVKLLVTDWSMWIWSALYPLKYSSTTRSPFLTMSRLCRSGTVSPLRKTSINSSIICALSPCSEGVETVNSCTCGPLQKETVKKNKTSRLIMDLVLNLFIGYLLIFIGSVFLFTKDRDFLLYIYGSFKRSPCTCIRPDRSEVSAGLFLISPWFILMNILY